MRQSLVEELVSEIGRRREAISEEIGTAIKRGLSPNDVPVSRKRSNRKAPGLPRELFLVPQGPAYLLTWILSAVPPPRPGRGLPPLETSFTQSVPSPL